MPRPIEIPTPRFVLRELTPADATNRYLAWFDDDDARRYITAARNKMELADIEAYIRERCGREDVLFLGIFDKATGAHVGNIKYEPVNSVEGYAVMGVLIGDPAFRGKGVTTEVLAGSSAWLKDRRGIRKILLGVSRENTAAIRAYEKAGYIASADDTLPSAGPATLIMVSTL